MIILLKNAKFQNKKGEWNIKDILIENNRINRIECNIEKKEADFTLFLEKRVVTPGLFYYQEKPLNLMEDNIGVYMQLIKDNIKRGFINYVITLGEDISHEILKQFSSIFVKNFLRLIFVVNIENKNYHIPFDIPYIYKDEKGRIYYNGSLMKNELQKDIVDNNLFKHILNIEETEIKNNSAAHMVIWDTYGLSMCNIPYIIIANGKIILREGMFIF